MNAETRFDDDCQRPRVSRRATGIAIMVAIGCLTAWGVWSLRRETPSQNGATDPHEVFADSARGEEPAGMRHEPPRQERPEPRREPRRDGDWLVLFDGANPDHWNTDFDDGITFSVAHEPLKDEGIEWLRLTRGDTGASVIIPMEWNSLHGVHNVSTSIVWNGRAERRHSLGLNSWKLGIASREWIDGYNGSVPAFVVSSRLAESSDDVVGIGGWGFGQFNRYRSGQAFIWNNEAIRTTTFRIAVKTGPLDDDEKALLLTKSE